MRISRKNKLFFGLNVALSGVIIFALYIPTTKAAELLTDVKQLKQKNNSLVNEKITGTGSVAIAPEIVYPSITTSVAAPSSGKGEELINQNPQPDTSTDQKVDTTSVIDKNNTQTQLQMPNSISYDNTQISSADQSEEAQITIATPPAAPEKPATKTTIQKKQTTKELAFNFTLPKVIEPISNDLLSASSKTTDLVNLPLLSMWEPLTKISPYNFTPLSRQTTSRLYTTSFILFLLGLLLISKNRQLIDTEYEKPITAVPVHN
jgi:hypothetical protein